MIHLSPSPFKRHRTHRYSRALDTQLTLDPASARLWSVEASTSAATLNADFIVSKQRSSYLVKSVEQLNSDVASIQATLKLGQAYQVGGYRLGGTVGWFGCLLGEAGKAEQIPLAW